MSERMTIVTVLSEQKYDGGRFPYDATLRDVIEFLSEVMEEIPAEYRESARCAFDSVSSWEDSHYASIEISYQRPMTEAEIEEEKSARRARANEEIRWAQRRLEDARRALKGAGGAD